LREFMAERVPQYMVPSSVMVLDRLPLSPNGKVDRAALPSAQDGRAAAARQFVAPRDAVEELIAQTWTEVLGATRVGVDDNFFELGGHSLQAVQIAFRIRAAFGVELGIKRILEAPTVARLAEVVTADLAASQAVLEEALGDIESLPDEVVRELLAGTDAGA
ncbi:hypothetical protein KGA66_28895, partial [Actinocrinis puniceicyclus]